MSATPSLAGIVRAETVKLSLRTSVRLTLAVLILLSIGSPILLFLVKSMVVGATVTTTTTAGVVATVAPAQGPAAVNVASALESVRFFHDLFLFRTLLIAVVAVSFAGEFVGRTLREDVLRPVSRTQVLLAKWLAIQVFVAAGALVPVLIGGLLGLALLGTGGDVTAALSSWGLTWAGDAGFATMVMAISLATRSVPGTIGGTVLYWVFDKMLRLLLLALEAARDQGLLEKLFAAYNLKPLTPISDFFIALRPFLPSSAFDLAPSVFSSASAGWQGFLALALYTAGSAAVAWRVFNRIDID